MRVLPIPPPSTAVVLLSCAWRRGISKQTPWDTVHALLFFFFSLPVRYERVIEHLWRKQLAALVQLTEILGREMDQNPPKHIVQCQISIIYDIYELESQMREQYDTK